MAKSTIPSKPSPAIASTEDFNFDWRFMLGDEAHARESAHDDSDWRQLRLPHDWSIEFPFDPECDGATGYLPGGIGWYRKRFMTDTQDDRLHFILFDGVYNNCEVWFNGEPLGQNPYGYSPFWFELTPHVRILDEEQVLAVRVDHSCYVDSRWYTGSGIYRDVVLVTKSRLHIPIWGTRLTTPEVSAARASVALEITIKNAFPSPCNVTLHTVFSNADGEEVASAEGFFVLEAGHKRVCTQTVDIASPDLWRPEHPALYRARTYVQCDDEIHEIYDTPFGIRTFVFDPNEGFFLNGEHTKIKGVCLHHDAGLVGAAVPDGVWRRRLATLKNLGCNAIRTAHNPASDAFLTLCDEMGFLVQAEFFDEWDEPKDKRLNSRNRHDDYASRGYTEHFQQWAESDLKRTMLRDRNHPCIIQWSIGNEIEWTFPRYAYATGYFDADADGNYFWTVPPYSADDISARFEEIPEGKSVLAITAAKLAGWTREMDPTRPVTANCILPSASHITGYAATLDVVGYSYRQVIYDLGHRLYPDVPIMGAENLGQWHEWKHVAERPFVSGLFFWTGIDYLGEAHAQWPRKGTHSGILNLAGFEQARTSMIRALWRDEPHVHLTTQLMEKSPYHVNDEGAVEEREEGWWKRRLWYWHDVNEHWNYTEDALIAVEVYSNCEEVELLLNGRSLGSQLLENQEDRVFKWAIPFEAGELEVRGRRSDGWAAEDRLTTAGEPASIIFTTDKSTLAGDGYDVAHLVAQMVDEKGVPVRHLQRELVFAVDGPCRTLGVDNGAIDSVQPYQSDRVTTAQDRALLILQSEQTTGWITARAESGTLRSADVQIKVV